MTTHTYLNNKDISSIRLNDTVQSIFTYDKGSIEAIDVENDKLSIKWDGGHLSENIPREKLTKVIHLGRGQ